MPPLAELRKRPQDGISWVQKVAAVEIGFRVPPGYLPVVMLVVDSAGDQQRRHRRWHGYHVQCPQIRCNSKVEDSNGVDMDDYLKVCRFLIKLNNEILGVIDVDYRDQVGIVLFNHSETDFTVKPGDRVIEMIIQVIAAPEVAEVEDLDATVRSR
ncbi:Deoxyuridine 5'-triphosphate nucleotidohydrolase [Triticum urartu]|uniref:dUTP diphosphatase n=1 Tax=Triticum urartu TaxID=4572 RepID=M7ZWA6_TRIUA|nr:Deoxyuridine 5'-triphosphate nucleotidohydrolase [Triticum urartu]